MSSSTTSNKLIVRVNGEEGKSKEYFVFTLEATILPSLELRKLLAAVGSNGMFQDEVEIKNSIEEFTDVPITTVKLFVVNTGGSATPYAELRDIATILLDETGKTELELVLRKEVCLNMMLLDLMVNASQPDRKVSPLVTNRQDTLAMADLPAEPTMRLLQAAS